MTESGCSATTRRCATAAAHRAGERAGRRRARPHRVLCALRRPAGRCRRAALGRRRYRHRRHASRARATRSCMSPRPDAPLPPVGATVEAVAGLVAAACAYADAHGAASAVRVLPGAAVTGGQIGADKSRLDFDLSEAADEGGHRGGLNALIGGRSSGDDGVGGRSVLDTNPTLVRTCRSNRRAAPGGCGWCGSARATRRWTCNPAAARMWRAPARSARCGAQDREQGPAEPPRRPWRWRNRIRR
jgi:hypothetical protein